MFKKGGILSSQYGTTLPNAYVAGATKEKPVLVNTPLVFDNTGDYQFKVAVDGDAIDAISQGVVRSEQEAVMVYLTGGFTRNILVEFEGTLAVGDSIVAAADNKYKKATEANSTRVMLVNAANNTAEVLI